MDVDGEYIQTAMNDRSNSAANRTATLLTVALWAFSITPGASAAETYPVSVERGITAQMRDGVTLRADIYRPRAEGKFPVLSQ